MPRITAIVPVYNYPNIRKCLLSITRQDREDYEVLVVDDGSTDSTPAVLAEFPSVKVLRKEQGGAASARNAGAHAAQGEFLVFLDADCVVSPDYLSRMIAPIEADPAIGMTHAIYGIENHESLVARLIYEKCDFIFRDLVDMDFAWSFGLGIRKEVFHRIGMFDRRFPGAGSEDIDFAYRVCDAGLKIRLVREAVVRHHFHDTLPKHLRRHRAQARLRMMLLTKVKRYTDQQAQPSQYLNLLTHGAFWASLPLAPWLPLLPLLLLLACMSFHYPLASWAVRKTGQAQYWLFLPFEFITISAWVVGCGEGLVWIWKNRSLQGEEPGA